MSCTVYKQAVLVAPEPPITEALTGLDEGTVVEGSTILLGDFQGALIWMQLSVATAGPANLPFSFCVFAVLEDDTVEALPFACKNFCGATDWNGITFLELGDTTFGAAQLKYPTMKGFVIGFEGDNAVVYDTTTTLLNPQFLEGKNIAEELIE